MKILIVAATRLEIMPFLNHHHLANNNFIQTAKFDTLITGVGMVATAFSLGAVLNNSYELVLNVGIAGSFDKQYEIGTLVQITEDSISELGAEDHHNFIPIEGLGFGMSKFYSSSDINLNLPKVKGITVNTVHGNKESIQEVVLRFSPQVESMEGAAVFYACQQKNIPALQVRSISNLVEARNQCNWNIPLAVRRLNDWLIGFMNQK